MELAYNALVDGIHFEKRRTLRCPIQSAPAIRLSAVNPQWQDKFLWPIIKIVWEPFSLKKVHWWHWQKFDGEIGPVIKVAGDKSSLERRANFFANLYYTNFSWSKCAVLSPMHFRGEYRRGFRAIEGGEIRTELCNVLLSGPHAGLIVGPSDTEFFALSYPDNIPISLELIEITKKDKLLKNVPLT
jgi:hypothetical protein